MPVDLTDRLPAMPDYVDPNEWTPEKLRAQLDAWKIQYQWHDGKAKPPACLFCHDTEGNPTFGVTDGNPWYRCHRSNKCDKRWSDVLEYFAPKQHLPVLSLADLPTKYPKPRESVVEGLIRRGDVCNIVGGPKSRKSFLVLQLAISVAAGLPFLGRQTCKGKVLLCDNEMRPDDLGRRALAVADALGIPLPTNVEVMTLRGHLASVHTIRTELARRQQRYQLVICDALYKLLPEGTDENSNSSMAAVYVEVDALAEEQDSACLLVHHLSKGAQHAKSVSDLGAGAGAQSRSADVHMAMREHEAENTVVLAAIVRSQLPVEPICLEFVYPLWRLAPEKNPGNVAVTNKKPNATIDAFLKTIPVEPSPKKETLAASKLALGISRDSLDALAHEATKRGLIEIVVPTNRASPHLISRVKA